jgi:putative acetyltransferase
MPNVRDARPDEIDAVRRLFREYERSLDVDLCFQGFEEEVANLPGDYAVELRGALLVAEDGGALCGCVAVRGLPDGACEMKRLYVRPQARGLGVGRALVEEIAARGRSLGYPAMRLDTLPAMEAAQRLYCALGFVEIPPYRPNPVAGASFWELRLSGG